MSWGSGLMTEAYMIYMCYSHSLNFTKVAINSFYTDFDELGQNMFWFYHNQPTVILGILNLTLNHRTSAVNYFLKSSGK